MQYQNQENLLEKKSFIPCCFISDQGVSQSCIVILYPPSFIDNKYIYFFRDRKQNITAKQINAFNILNKERLSSAYDLESYFINDLLIKILFKALSENNTSVNKNNTSVNNSLFPWKYQGAFLSLGFFISIIFIIYMNYKNY